ncbi:MAG: hypothetical protein ACYC6Y_15535, partial [Thermoguttaceae bacterium]
MTKSGSWTAMAAALAVCLACEAPGADWPAFRGPNGDGICTETGLLRQWPEAGPPLLWRNDQIGNGLAGVSVHGALLYTMSELNGVEYIVCVDTAGQGRTIWGFPVGPVRHNGGGYPGPRCTP